MYPNQDAIFERLETTKQFGLLSDYLVSWTGRAMSRILLKLAERSLPSMLLRDFQLFVKIPVMQLI